MKSRTRRWLVGGEPRGPSQRVRLVALVLVPLLGACSDGTGPSGVVRITPASQTVTLQQTPSGPALRTSVTLTNTSSRPVVYDPCALSLEKKVDYVLVGSEPSAPWAKVWAPVCTTLSAAIGIVHAAVAPHSSITIPIDAGVGPSPFQGLSFDGSPGIYRVYLALQTDIIGVPREIPHDLSVSDPFMIVIQ